MANFVLAYKGGSMAETPEAQEAAMKAWGDWFGTLGFGGRRHGRPVRGVHCRAGGRVDRNRRPRACPAIRCVQADSLELAAKLAGGCPVLTGGGTVEVYEAIAM